MCIFMAISEKKKKKKKNMHKYININVYKHIYVKFRNTLHENINICSEIPLLRPLKIKIFYPLKTLFAKFKLFFSSFSTPSVHLIKTTFGQSQRWS